MDIYLLSLLLLLLSTSISTSISNNYTSKLLSLSIKNAPSFNTKTKYFSTNHIEFDIDPYDDIATLNIFNNQIIVNTHLNETYTLSLTHAHFNNLSHPISIFLDYDDLSDWNSIFSHSHSHLFSTRRRLGYYNHYKHKGRYIADGILRRFKDGQANCRHLYGDLASIMSKEEEEKVKDLCAMWNLGNCWIGYKKPWGHWEDGRRPTYLHWKPGEPNNYGGNEDCAEIHTSGQWNDIKCTLSRVAICERARIHVVGHYIAVMRLLNFDDANKRCQELFSTDLATIENARENVMVRRACAAINPEGACWIGLKRPFRTWMDGEDAKVMNWGEGEPNNAGGNENCAEIKESQRWNDNNCAIGQYFVCNTITQQTRMKKRAEQKRRAQEREAELDKKRKKIEDEIMERYMQQNQNSMMGKMLSGQSLYGAGGIGSMAGNMMAYGAGLPDMKQMYAMGSRQGQQMGMFNHMLSQQTGSMGGIGQKYGNLDSVIHHRPNYRYNHGSLDNDLSTLSHRDSKAIYGDLGPLGKSDGVSWTPGKPLQIQLVGRRRRRLQMIEKHKFENVFDDIFGKKCVKIMNDFGVLLCVGHNYIDWRQYDHESIGQRKKMKRQFEHRMNVSLNDESVSGNGYWINDEVGYYVLEQFVFDNDQSGDLKQCFDVIYGFKVCLKYIENGKNMMLMIGNDELSVFDFERDEHWDEVETIYKREKSEYQIMKKCNDVIVGRIETKMCIQQTINKEDNLSFYRLIVQYLVDAHFDK